MLYRLITDCLQPLLIFLLAAALIHWRAWRRLPKPRPRVLGFWAAWFALYCFCTPIVAYLAGGTLEWQHPPAPIREPVRAIVVLGGDVLPPDEVRKEAQLGPSSIYRCLQGAKVYHAHPDSLIVVSGGKVNPLRPGPPGAELMRDFLVQLDVDVEDILVQPKSRSTHEDAVHTAELLRARGIDSAVLVTEAVHLERGLRCFRAQGIDVIPSGCRYRASRFPGPLLGFIPRAYAAQRNEEVFHEWLGLAWYWLRGRI